MSWPIHGSNPHYLYDALHIPMPDEIIDFSVNLNPLGPPPSIKRNWDKWFDIIEDYPDPNGYELTLLISEKEDVLKEKVLLGNGGAEIITLLAKMLEQKQVLLIQPTFSEYERMCLVYGCHISHFTLREEQWELDVDLLISKAKSVDAIFLCNPNNPSGIYYKESNLHRLAEACEQNKCYLIIDEAFHDFIEDSPTMALLIEQNKYLIIIRSLTKMYAIAGLRLGYIMANKYVIETLRKYQTHWSVNALALLAGKECLSSGQYVDETVKFINEERSRIIYALRSVGYIISNSLVNFYLLRDANLNEQLPLFTFLLNKGIVPRHTANYPGLNGRWLRFAVKGTEDNDVLLEALIQWKKGS